MAKTIGDFLYSWQTLIAGGIAILAAWITVVGLRGQERRGLERKSRAARALLPAALASVNDYTLATIHWLIETKAPAGFAETSTNNSDTIPLPQLPPEPDRGIFDILKDCVEHTEAEPAQSIAKVLSKLQVHRSRLTTLYDRIANKARYSSTRVLLHLEIDQYTAKAIELHATADRLFPFARMETDNAPASIDLAAVSNAFRVCGLDDFKNAGVWNELTAPYLPKNSTKIADQGS